MSWTKEGQVLDAIRNATIAMDNVKGFVATGKALGDWKAVEALIVRELKSAAILLNTEADRLMPPPRAEVKDTDGT